MAEIEPAAASPARPRIIIHAGFGKCGSSSIQRALFDNVGRMRKDRIYLLDKNLAVAADDSPRVVPHGLLRDAKKKGEHLAEKVAKEIASVAGGSGECAGVLSAESLVISGMAELFVGLDQQFDVSVVFYVRPQWQWIPSAWQQWFMKKGTTLDEFVSECLETHRPTFRASIEEWKSVLPGARLYVRFLIPELLTGGSPARDFFHLLGGREDGYEFEDEPRNTSLDFAVVHVLSKNPHLFSGIHDNRLKKGLRRVLPKKFQTANIRMLSSEQEARIEEYFREDNLWLLQTFCSGVDVNEIYRTHFAPPKADTRYSSISEVDLIYRCFGIILESIAIRRRGRSSQKGGQPQEGEQPQEILGDNEVPGFFEPED